MQRTNTSQPESTRNVPLILNISGVICWFLLLIFMSLWAFNIIFPGPDTAPEITNYLKYVREQNRTMRTKDCDSVYSFFSYS